MNQRDAFVEAQKQQAYNSYNPPPMVSTPPDIPQLTKALSELDTALQEISAHASNLWGPASRLGSLSPRAGEQNKPLDAPVSSTVDAVHVMLQRAKQIAEELNSIGAHFASLV